MGDTVGRQAIEQRGAYPNANFLALDTTENKRKAGSDRLKLK